MCPRHPQGREGGGGWKSRGAVQALSCSRGRPVARRVPACPGLPTPTASACSGVQSQARLGPQLPALG